MSGLPNRERAEVRIKDDSELDWDDATEQDYETIEVFDHVTVVEEHYVNSVNGHESFTGKISGGDAAHLDTPDAVTARVADYLWHEFHIDKLPLMDIRVVDIESDDVQVI